MTDHATTTIAEELRSKLESLTPSERKPAQWLLANYPMAGLETVSNFADQSGVSAPTVLRLLAKIGFSSYPAFQTRLRDEVKARLASPLSRGEGKGTAEAFDDRPTISVDSLTKHALAATGNIQALLENVARADFNATVDLLGDSDRKICLIGGRITDSIARYCHRHLRLVRPGVLRASSQSATWPETLSDLDKGDVLLVFDARRYQKDVEVFAEQAAARGVVIILVTDQWLSPISRFARHIFPLHIDVQARWDSHAATLVLTEALIGALLEQNWDQVKGRLATLEQLRTQAQTENP